MRSKKPSDWSSLRELLKEYDEELYEKQLEEDYVQECVDRAESLLLAEVREPIEFSSEDAEYDYYEDRYGTDHGQDDFGHEYYGDEDDPFYNFAHELDDKHQDLEEKFEPRRRTGG